SGGGIAFWWPTIGIILTMVSIIVPGIAFGRIAFTDPLLGFKGFGVSAAALAAVAAGLRLWAHRGNIHLDGLGKALGFSAAILACFASLALSYVEGALT